MSELARRYAHALYELCPDEQALEQTSQALMAQGALWEALCSPAVQAQEKGRVLARLPLLEGEETLRRFYTLLTEKGRMALLPDVVQAFHHISLAQRGAALCTLTCVRAPQAQELDKLSKTLCRLHHLQEVVFDIRTDPALLGGFVLELEGVTYDKSVRGTLAGMARQLEERRMA